MDIFQEVDRSEKIQRIRKDGDWIEVDLDRDLSDYVKMLISRIIDLSQSTVNGIRTPFRSIAEYDSEPWVNIQIEKYVVGLIQKRNAKP